MSKIDFDFSAAGRGTVSIDGEPVKGVRAATIQMRNGQATTVTLELVGHGAAGNAPDVEDVYVETTDIESSNKQYERFPARVLA